MAKAEKTEPTLIKVNLDRTYTISGEHYGPGIVEIDQSILPDKPTVELKRCLDAADGSETPPAPAEPEFAGHPLSFFKDKTDDQIRAVDGVTIEIFDKIKTALMPSPEAPKSKP